MPKKPDDDQAQPAGLTQLVTPLRSVPEQIGGHVLGALGQPNTVALLSTVVAGIERDQVVSIPLTPQQFQAIQRLLAEIIPPQQLSPIARRAVGFRLTEEEE